MGTPWKEEIVGLEVSKTVLWILYSNQQILFLGVSSGPAKKKKYKGFWYNGLFYQPRKRGAAVQNLTNVTTGEILTIVDIFKLFCTNVSSDLRLIHSLLK